MRNTWRIRSPSLTLRVSVLAESLIGRVAGSAEFVCRSMGKFEDSHDGFTAVDNLPNKG